jgi:hypothetical protein
VKSSRSLAKETGTLMSSSAKAKKLRTSRPYKANAVYALQSRDSASRMNFYYWFLQSVYDGEVDHILLFSDKA